MKLSKIAFILFMFVLALLGHACSKNHPPVGNWKTDAGRALVQLAEDGTASARVAFEIPNAEKPPESIDGYILDAAVWIRTYFSEAHYKSTLQTKEGRNTSTIIFNQREKAEDQIPWMKLPVHSDTSGKISVIRVVDGRSVTGYSVSKAGRILATTEVSGTSVRMEGISFTAGYVDTSVVWHGVLEINGRYRVEHNVIEIYVPVAMPQQSVELIVGMGTIEGNSLRFDSAGSELITGSFARVPKEVNPSIDLAGANEIDPKDIQGVKIAESLYVNTAITVGRVQNVKYRLPGRQVLGTFVMTEPTGGQIPSLTIERGVN